MFKKALILAGLLLVALAVACGGSSKSDNTGKGATTAATTVATSQAAATAAKGAPTAEAADTGSSDTSFNPLGFMTGQMFGSDALAAEGAVAGAADPT